MGKGKKGKKGKKHYGKKAKRYARKARSRTYRFLKGAALEAPLIVYIGEGIAATRGQPVIDRIVDAISRLGLGITGFHYTMGSGQVKFMPEYLALGWGGPLAYKGVQFLVNAIPGQKDSPFAELSKMTGG